MNRTLVPFLAGFAASYAGYLGPQSLIFLAGFGAGYWFAKNEYESETEVAVEEELKLTVNTVTSEDIQPYDSDNTDEFYTEIEDLNTGEKCEGKTKLALANNRIFD